MWIALLMSLTQFSQPVLVNPVAAVSSETPGARFGYEAIEDKKRRKPPTAVTQHEDRHLTDSQRRKLIGTTQDLKRNYAVAAWMIRRHLDYVTQFEFHARTKDEAFNTYLEAKVRQWARPGNCDVTGRFWLRKLIRHAESCAIVDGDMGFLALASGQLQGIESDRIRTPTQVGSADGEWFNGVRVNRAGRPIEYAVHRRIGGGQAFELDRLVPARNLFLHAKVERFDQVRGVSPLTAAITDLTDIKENKTYALLKSKVAQLIGLVLKRDADDSAGEVDGSAATETDGSENRSKYDVDFGRGPFQLDLDREDTAEFLSVDTPGSTFKDFHQLVLMVALKSLDIPYSFFDEGHTNFFGSRGSWMLYDRACVDKREDVAELLRKITVWKLVQWILWEEITLPNGLASVADIDFEWVSIGMPWWDPSKEIKGDMLAIGAGLDTPQRICKERGRGEFRDNVDQIAAALEYAKSKGVTLSFDTGPEPVQVETAPPPQTGGGA